MFLFNRAGSKQEATNVQKVQEDINVNPDSLKLNSLPACVSVPETEDNSIESSDLRESSYSREEGKEKGHSKLAEERSNKDSSVQERYSKESSGFDDRPQKKRKLDGSDGKGDTGSFKRPRDISSDGKRGSEAFKRPKDKETGDEVPPEKPSLVKEKRDLGVSVSEGRDAKTAKKPSFDGRLLKRAEELADDYERGYQVIEVKQKPDAVSFIFYYIGLEPGCFMRILPLILVVAGLYVVGF